MGRAKIMGVYWQAEKRPCEVCGEKDQDEFIFNLPSDTRFKYTLSSGIEVRRSSMTKWLCGPCSVAWERYCCEPPFKRPYKIKNRPDWRFSHIDPTTGLLDNSHDQAVSKLNKLLTL